MAPMMNEYDQKTLGGRLKWLRGKYGLGLVQFAGRIGFSNGYCSQVEGDEARRPSLEFQAAVLREFDVCGPWLTSGTGEPFWHAPWNRPNSNAGPIEIDPRTADQIVQMLGETIQKYDADALIGLLHDITHNRTLDTSYPPPVRLRAAALIAQKLLKKLPKA